MGKRIIWSATAIRQLKEIKRDVFETSKSIRSTNRLVRDIFESTDNLSHQPEIYPLDKNKINNDESYRCYEVRTCNMSYRILEDTIRIIRVRYSGKEPQNINLETEVSIPFKMVL